MRKKAYLAGPEVFFDEALKIAKYQKDFCIQNNLIGLSPLENELPQTNSKSETAKAIVKANMDMIRQCDIIIANLHNFRGSIRHPSCDSGTAWECGYASALGKPILAYTDGIRSVPEKLRFSIDCCLIGEFEESIYYYNNFDTSKKSHDHNYSDSIILDPEHSDIYDADPYGAFMLGYQCGSDIEASYKISDKRSLIEKYGSIDRNGAKFEDFDLPVNIMIAVNHKLE